MVFTVLGALTVFTDIVVPLALLIASFLPAPRGTDGPSRRSPPISRREAVLFCLVVATAVGFEVSMSTITKAGGGSKSELLGEQLTALVTFSGDLAATVFAYMFIAALVLVVPPRRAGRHSAASGSLVPDGVAPDSVRTGGDRRVAGHDRVLHVGGHVGPIHLDDMSGA